ncbi:MAG: isoaspartyl peptidase/L-asparaginase [Ignavibacteria bacterium]|nr:isoaspartyl peptidase/L-asparaginase [Ignavibacteria bacterium]
MKKISIAIHGGAGTILRSNMTQEIEQNYVRSLNDAVTSGWNVLTDGGSALDAVTETVRSLEDDPLFNAGRGSVFTSDATHEMDAAVMDGLTKNAGAVSLVSKVRNPVLLARLIMENTDHIFLCGAAAEKFAEEHGIVPESDEYFFTQARFDQLQKAKSKAGIILDHSDDKQLGTVGAVALDSNGNLAAATSTGGMTNKWPGRVGDSAIIGAGTYADNDTCAVSCTGHGEYFMRAVTAYEVSALMKLKGLSLEGSAWFAIHESLAKLGGKGGLIAVDRLGNVAMPFNSEGMYRACFTSGMDEPLIAIFEN